MCKKEKYEKIKKYNEICRRAFEAGVMGKYNLQNKLNQYAHNYWKMHLS